MATSTNRPKRWIRRTFWSLLLLALTATGGFFLYPVSYFNAWTYLREDFSGVESRAVRVDGYRMHYLAEGPADGQAIVLVHGLGARAEDWSNLAPYLAQAGFRVYMPDLVGYGRSERPANFSYSVRDEANIVVDFMNTMGIRQAEVGGWSMGGWIAVLVAAQHPERVSRLMLFDSAGLYVRPEFNTALFTPVSRAQLSQLQALLTPRPRPIPAFIARDILRNYSRNGWVVQRALATMLTGQDVVDGLLPRLRMPVLLAWGALDRITPLAQGQAMHSLIPQSQLDVFAGCGHLAPMECAAAEGPKVAAFARQ